MLSNMGEITQLSEEAEAVSKQCWQLADPLERGAFDLKEPFRTFCIVEYVSGLIDNGGFRYFFENNFPAGVSYNEIILAFREIGAIKAAEAIEEALNLYPQLKDPEDIELRREILDIECDEPTELWTKVEMLEYRVGFNSVANHLSSYVRINRTRFSEA